MSRSSEIRISLPISLRRPFIEGGKQIVERPRDRLFVKMTWSPSML
jgi:hypothetical protein